jgi:Holliday junction resolvase
MVWRNTNHTRSNRRSSHYRKGVPDILGVWNGRALAIEVKKPDGQISKEQVQFLEEFCSLGGIGFVAKSVEDVVKRLLQVPP